MRRMGMGAMRRMGIGCVDGMASRGAWDVVPEMRVWDAQLGCDGRCLLDIASDCECRVSLALVHPS